MSRIHVPALLACATLLLPLSIAHGQAIFGGGNAAANPTSNQGSATDKGIAQCQGGPGGSRMRNRDRGGCQELAETPAATTEQQIRVTLQAPDPPQAGRGRETDQVGQLLVGEPPIALESVQDPQVDGVEIDIGHSCVKTPLHAIFCQE